MLKQPSGPKESKESSPSLSLELTMLLEELELQCKPVFLSLPDALKESVTYLQKAEHLFFKLQNQPHSSLYLNKLLLIIKKYLLYATDEFKKTLISRSDKIPFKYFLLFIKDDLCQWDNYHFYVEMKKELDNLQPILRNSSITCFKGLHQPLIDEIAKMALGENLKGIPSNLLSKAFDNIVKHSIDNLDKLAKLAIQGFRDNYSHTFSISETLDKQRLLTVILKSRFSFTPDLPTRLLVRYSMILLAQDNCYPTQLEITRKLNYVFHTMESKLTEIVSAIKITFYAATNNNLSDKEKHFLHDQLLTVFAHALVDNNANAPLLNDDRVIKRFIGELSVLFINNLTLTKKERKAVNILGLFKNVPKSIQITTKNIEETLHKALASSEMKSEESLFPIRFM